MVNALGLTLHSTPDLEDVDQVVQNLTKLLANVALKFLSWNVILLYKIDLEIWQIHWYFVNVFENTLATAVNEFVISEFVKLTMLWTTEPRICITKTYLYNFDPLEPHFYIEKLGFTGVIIIFLIFAQNIDCGYSLEPPHR